MEKTIGQMIGVIVDHFSVKNDQDETVNMSAKYDVSGASDEVIKAWIAKDRRIAYQATLRKKTADEIRALKGKTVVFDGSRTKVTVDPEEAMANKLSRMSPDEASEYVKSLLRKAGK